MSGELGADLIGAAEIAGFLGGGAFANERVDFAVGEAFGGASRGFHHVKDGIEAVEEGDGSIAIAGSTAYVQNPTGGSISESAEPLLAVLPATSGPAKRLPLPAGPRHNQVRTVAAWLHGWVIGGLQNGPGTHSADSDPTLLTCDGFLVAQDF